MGLLFTDQRKKSNSCRGKKKDDEGKINDADDDDG
jgi:hypothetical protein